MLAVFIRIGCTTFTFGLLKTATLNTPSAEIHTYATVLTVTVSGRGGTTVSVVDGAASVTGAGRTVNVGAGQSTLVSRGQPPMPVPTPPAPPIVTEMTALLAPTRKILGHGRRQDPRPLKRRMVPGCFRQILMERSNRKSPETEPRTGHAGRTI
jgi:hypothetical protein